jgi:tetratricopeptide (TPR) repeat protein
MTQSKKRPKGWLVGKQQINDWLDTAQAQIAGQDYSGALRTAKRILKYIPKNVAPYAEALGIMGMVYALRKEFEQSFQALSQAVEIKPEDAYLWYNRGLSARFTSRTGLSLRDLEQAVRLEGKGKMADKFLKEVKFARQIAESEMVMRGRGFTLDQLIEQQELFQQGNNLSMQGKWQEAEVIFRRSIGMGDCLPQPWGNLGICLAMQNRFDEAEAAYIRAIEIDPQYQRAKEHMKNLEAMRAHPDEKPEFLITSPFQEVKTGLTLVKE